VQTSLVLARRRPRLLEDVDTLVPRVRAGDARRFPDEGCGVEEGCGEVCRVVAD
jgi:hypothetical protein